MATIKIAPATPRRSGAVIYTFTLPSPRVICEWIKENIETAPAEKLRCALEDALMMRQNPRRKRTD